jgi:Aromatic-ring-opening dioxygenase LigAB, LigA subunit
MSIYAVDKLCRRVVHDAELRAGLEQAPEATLRAARPALSEEQVRLLLAGDVGRLSRLGANSFLLHQLGRFQLLGLDLPTHGQRMRTEYAAERAARWQGSR